MPESNRIEEFLQKLAPCIERGELEACVEEAARLAGEMGIGARKVLQLSVKNGLDKNKYELAYVLALSAKQRLRGGNRVSAYYCAGLAAQFINKLEKSEEYYNKVIEVNPKDALAHFLLAFLLQEQSRKNEAEEHYKKAIQLDKKNAAIHTFYSLFLIDNEKLDDFQNEMKLASSIFKNAEDNAKINLIIGILYGAYSEINSNRKNFSESAIYANKAGELLLKSAETTENRLKNVLTLIGNLMKAKSFIRKMPRKSRYKEILHVGRNSEISELSDNLKNAALWYKKASLCVIGEEQDVHNACHSALTVYSDILSVTSVLIKCDNPYVNKGEWVATLKHAREIYIKKRLNQGVVLVDTLEQLINCVDELSNQKASGVDVHEYLKKCYNNLIDVSEKLDGALKIITYHAVDAIREYAKKQGMSFVREEKPKKSLWDSQLIKAISVILTVIAAIIALLQFLHLDSKALDFIKSLIPRLGAP